METREHTAEATARAAGWLTVREAAEELQIPKTRCYALIQSGDLPAVRIGEKSLRINRSELKRFLTSERRAGPGS